MTDSVLGRGTIELVADARQLKAGIEDAKKSIRTLGEGQKDVSAAASRSIDQYIGRLQAQNDMFGKSAREVEIYKLALRGASNEQINAANSALKLTEAHERSAAVASGLMAVAMAGAAAAVGFGVFIKSSIESEAKLHSLNLQTGLSVDILSALRPVAREAGTDLDNAAGMVNKLEKNMLSFAQTGGGKGAEAFKQLGYSQEQVKAGLQDMNTFLPEFAKRLIETGVGGEQAGLAMQLMGKGGAQALPFLDALSQRLHLIGTDTEESVKQAHEFEVQMARLSEQSGNFGRSIANYVVGPLNDIIKAFIEGKNAAGLYEGAIRAVSVFMSGSDLHRANKQFVESTDQLLQLQRELARADSSKMSPKNFEDYTGALKREIKDVEERLKGLRLMRDELEAAGNKPKTSPKPLVDLPGKTGGAGAQVENPYQNMITGLEKKLELEKESTEVERLMFDLDHMRGDQYAQLTIAQKANLEVTANAIDIKNRERAEVKALVEYYEQLDIVKKELAVAEAKEADAKGKAILAGQKTIEDIVFETEMLGKSNSEREMAIALRAMETAGIDKQDVAYKAFSATLHDVSAIKQAKEAQIEAAKASQDVWKTAAKDMQRSMSSFFFDVMQGKTTSLVSSFKAMIDKMVADQLAAQASLALFGAGFSKTGDLGPGSLIGKALAWWNTPSTAALNSGGNLGYGGMGLLEYATGTDYVPKTGPYILHEGEKVTTAADNKAGRSVVINMPLNFSGPQDSRSVSQGMVEGGRRLQRELARNT